jgi:CDP-glycerol glycerophosphotransferase (TagB/SpsB family)
MLGALIKRLLFNSFFEIPLLYISMLFPRNRNLLLFGSWCGQKYDDNPRFLFEYVVDNRPDLRAVWLSQNIKVVDEVRKKGYPACYSYSKRGIQLALSAKYIINAVSDYGGDLGPGIKRFFGNAVFINTWHGIPIKKIVFDDVSFAKTHKRSRIKQIPRKKSYYIASSEVIVNRYISAFRTDKDHVLNLGYARNDYFYISHFNPLNQLLSGKKAIIYMPTHRKEGRVQLDVSKLLDYNKMQLFCEQNDCLFVIKKHFYHRKEHESLEVYSRIIDVTPFNYSAQEVLDAADILISDFSGAWIDYLLLDRPIVFYPFDLEDYLKTDRDMYDDYFSIIPGPVCLNQTDLLNTIETLVKSELQDSYQERRKEVRDYYFSPQNQCPVAQKQIDTILSL